MEIYPTEQLHLTKGAKISLGKVPRKEGSMVIANSTVSMASGNRFDSYSFTQMSIMKKVSGDEQKQNSLGYFQNLLKQSSQINEPVNRINSPSTQWSVRLQLLHKIMAAILRNHGMGSYTMDDYSGQMEGSTTNYNMGIEGSVWEVVEERQSVYREVESTTFTSRGMAQTADGRTIEFGVDLTMSRSFTSVMGEYRSRQYFITDPLVINVDSNTTQISDVKFFFDLDCDGEKEEISTTGAGTGFLAMDANGDGIINDGSELFGTKSGDGFADLAKYDFDGNGWIDEADDIFNKLRVWTKDEEGNDQLIDLKKAGVGAIYLGSAATSYSFMDTTNTANGFLKSTGIYLKENGGVGTIAQVDLTT